ATRLAATAGDPSLVARAQALYGLLVAYRGDYRTAMATIAAALDMIDGLPPGIGTAHRRAQQIGRSVNRGTLVAGLARGGRLAEARRQGKTYLASFAVSTATLGERAAFADAHNGLGLAYAFQGEPELTRRSYAVAVSTLEAIDFHVFALINLREELMFAVLPYRADDLAERERVAAVGERMAAWVVGRGGHPNPNLPRYARVLLLVLEGRWREVRGRLEQTDPSDLTILSRFRPLYLGTIARAQGTPRWRGGACTSRR